MPSRAGLAAAQARTFVQYMAEHDNPYPLVLAGDFNFPPGPDTDSIYAAEQGGDGAFVEVDYPQNERTYQPYQNKIDYLFGGRDLFTTTVDGEVLDRGLCAVPGLVTLRPCSDHYPLYGTLPIREDLPPLPDGGPAAGDAPALTSPTPFVSGTLEVPHGTGQVISLVGPRR